MKFPQIPKSSIDTPSRASAAKSMTVVTVMGGVSGVTVVTVIGGVRVATVMVVVESVIGVTGVVFVI